MHFETQNFSERHVSGNFLTFREPSCEFENLIPSRKKEAAKDRFRLFRNVNSQDHVAHGQKANFLSLVVSHFHKFLDKTDRSDAIHLLRYVLSASES